MSCGIPRAANLDGLCLRPHVYQDHNQTSVASNISIKKTRQINEFKSLQENFPFASLASVHSFGFWDARTRRSSNLHNKGDSFVFTFVRSTWSGFDAQTQWICDFVILFHADNTAEISYGVRVQCALCNPCKSEAKHSSPVRIINQNNNTKLAVFSVVVVCRALFAVWWNALHW